MKTPLSRRTILRGMGTAVALPFLDAMAPAFANPRRNPAQAPVRMAFVYVPNGIIMQSWTPETVGRGFELTPVLQPLARHRERILVLSGLSQINGRALGDGPGDHARAAASYLTGVHPKKTDGADIRNGISVDQVAAQAIGHKTRFASLELSCEHGGMVGNCDSGYSCAYSNSVSWRSENTPMPPEVNPRLVFERLFGSGDELLDPATRAKRQRYQKSILDFVREDTEKLNRELGAGDRRKLDEYLYAVREIEQRIAKAEKESADRGPSPTPEFDAPAGIPAEFADHAKLMFDLMAVAFQTDVTRIATLMLGREGSNRTYREIEVPDPHHGISHHRGDEEKVAKLVQINQYHTQLFAGLIDRLAAIQEGDGTLLDSLALVYGSGLSDGNKHWHHDLPVMVAGGGAGLFHPGRHVRYPDETPMNNLFLSILDRMDVHPESLGDGTGKLEGLSDL